MESASHRMLDFTIRAVCCAERTCQTFFFPNLFFRENRFSFFGGKICQQKRRCARRFAAIPPPPKRRSPRTKMQLACLRMSVMSFHVIPMFRKKTRIGLRNRLLFCPREVERVWVRRWSQQCTSLSTALRNLLAGSINIFFLIFLNKRRNEWRTTTFSNRKLILVLRQRIHHMRRCA